MGDEFFKDTPFEAPKKKLRVRKWKMLEVVELDETDDDFDSEVELKEVEPKKKHGFNDFEQRQYSNDELESLLLGIGGD